jgi:hypothetical protein
MWARIQRVHKINISELYCEQKLTEGNNTVYILILLLLSVFANANL